MHRRKAQKVIFLKEDSKKKRVEWAKNHAEWTEEEWNRVIWSDEFYVVLGDPCHAQMCFALRVL
jgi:hypothetical protein